jgi:hypothetical protein
MAEQYVNDFSTTLALPVGTGDVAAARAQQGGVH